MEIPASATNTLLDDGKTIIMGPPSVWTADNVDQFKF